MTTQIAFDVLWLDIAQRLGATQVSSRSQTRWRTTGQWRQRGKISTQIRYTHCELLQAFHGQNDFVDESCKSRESSVVA